VLFQSIIVSYNCWQQSTSRLLINTSYGSGIRSWDLARCSRACYQYQLRCAIRRVLGKGSMRRRRRSNSVLLSIPNATRRTRPDFIGDPKPEKDSECRSRRFSTPANHSAALLPPWHWSVKSPAPTRVSDKSADFVWSGPVRSDPVRVRVVEFGTGPTRHVRAWDQVSDKVWSVSNSTTRTHGLCLRHDPTRPDPRTKSVHVEIEQTSLRPDKVGGLVGDPSGPSVWSGRVRVVEFRNDTTRPDQRQSLVGRV